MAVNQDYTGRTFPPGAPYEVSRVKISEFADGAAQAYEGLAAKSGLAVDVLQDHPNVLAGSPDSIADTLQERRETFGINYVTVQQSQAERFAPIVARLAGT